MSHFAALVILTPDYATKHDLDDSLAKYDENLEVEEYSRGEVSKFEKVRFVDYYSKKYKNVINKSSKPFYEKLVADGVIEPFVSEEIDDLDEEERYIFKAYNNRIDEFTDYILSLYPRLLNHFKRMYEKHGWDWNNDCWRINPETNKWEEYSSYNPDSKWDWYAIGNRWNGCLKTKSGEYVNTCYLDEIDWADFTEDDYEKEEKENIFGEKYKPLKEGVKYHFTKSNIPGYLVVDGEWHEQFKGLWFGLTDDKMSEDEWKEKFFSIIDNLPSDSEVTIVDVHI